MCDHSEFVLRAKCDVFFLVNVYVSSGVRAYSCLGARGSGRRLFAVWAGLAEHGGSFAPYASLCLLNCI